MKEEKRRVVNGVTYIDVIETTTYIERTITYPFGLQRVVRVKQAEPKPATENAQAGQIVIPKRGIIAVIVAGILGLLGIKAFNNHNQAADYDPDYDDDNDDVDEEDDDQDDDSEE